MAADTETSGNDMPAHAESYQRFMSWLKFGTIVTAIVAFLVVLLIAS